MLSEQQDGKTADTLFSDLKQSAEMLVKKLEEGDYHGVSSMIELINAERDRSIYKEVGRLTRGIHDAIVNFHVDTSRYNIPSQDQSAIVNAHDRLDYVINLTQHAANTTMDMVEQGIPVATSLGQESAQLRKEWGRLLRREMEPAEFRELYKRIDVFLAQTTQSADVLSEKFNSILMAQGFQDLTGQVIKKVMALVQDVEERLVDLVRVASQVEELTGLVRAVDQPPEKNKIEAEGPQIKPEGRADVVKGQDDVDDLLSSLGF